MYSIATHGAAFSEVITQLSVSQNNTWSFFFGWQ